MGGQRHHFLLYLLLFIPTLLFAQTNKDESDIKSVLNTQITLWNAGDVRGFMEYYEKSPWEPFEDMLVIANIVVMDDTFYFNDEPVNVC